jgi:Glycosyltransferase family 87
MKDRLQERGLAILAGAGWLLFAYITVTALRSGATSGEVFQVDWHVYWAGANDLVSGDLYRVPLDAGGRELSAEQFKLPPLSAVWAVPLLAVPIDSGGYVWQVIAALSIAATAVVACAAARIERPLLAAGLILGPLSLTLLYVEGLHLATNNYLVLGLVAGGAWCYLEGRDRWAGVLIGLAVATKLWPATLLIVALRERRLSVVLWAVGTLIVQALVVLPWLGIDILPALADVWRTEIPPTGFLIGPTAVPGLRDIWNSGLGAVVALVLLVLPLRKHAALGAAILAGLAPIENLWIHYGPTLLFAAGLLAVGVANARGRSVARGEAETAASAA